MKRIGRLSGKIRAYLLNNNRGLSLMELLMVVSIMSMAVGVAGISISLAYSRDSEKAAKSINAAMENTKMLSLSEKGTYTLTIDFEAHTLTITGSESAAPIHKETLQKRVSLSVPGDDSLTAVTVQFDKSTGKVKQMTGESNGVLRIRAENSSGKRASVILVKGTGKHYVDYAQN